MVVIVFNFLMFGLTDFVQDPATKNTIGSWMILIIISMIGANLLVIVLRVYKIVERKYKQRMMRKEYVRIKERIMKKYSIRMQDAIITSIKKEEPVEKVL
jgi:phosphate/sulfate permease